MAGTCEAISVCSQKDNVSPHTGHLLAQITFLHKEVDRLEKQLEVSRTRSASVANEVREQYEKIVVEKAQKIEELRTNFIHFKGNSSEELLSLVKKFEKNVETLQREKNSLESEKERLLNRIFEYESIISKRESEITDLVNQIEENRNHIKMQQDCSCGDAEVTIQKMNVISEDRCCKKCDVGTLAKTELEDKSCEALEDFFHGIGTTTNMEVPTVDSLLKIIESKTRDLEASNNALSRITAKYENDISSSRPGNFCSMDMGDPRTACTEGKEEFSTYIKVLECRVSEAEENQRMLKKKLDDMEKEKECAISTSMKIENEKNYLEAQLRQYEKDVEQLIAYKNLSSEQLHDASVENERLRCEIETRMKREAQLSFSIKAKEEEMQDLITTYRSAAKENELLHESNKALEREIDTIRGSIALKEDSVVFLREQIKSLNHREQQIILDLQSFEYDNDQLHRKVLKNEAYIAELEAANSDLKKVANAKDFSLEEIHQNMAELSKHLVIRENELVNIQRHCSTIEAECAELHASFIQEAREKKRLEEANAKLIAKNILDMSEAQSAKNREKNITQYQLEIEELEIKLKNAQRELEDEKALRKSTEKSTDELRSKLKDVEFCKERLQQVVLHQNEVLSSLSQ